MNKNMFKNAYFGKLYKTRDGNKAIYIYKETIYPFRHALSLGGVVNAMYKENGLYDMEIEADNYHADIVSEWDEPINEEELDRLAYTEFYVDGDCPSYESELDIFISAFKKGYQKAKNE